MQKHPPQTNATQEKIVQHSWRIVIFLVVGLLIGSVLIGSVVIKLPLVVQFDSYFYYLINGLPRNPILDALIAPVNLNFLHYGWSTLPSFLYVYVALFILYLAIFKRKLLIWAIVALLVGTFFVGILYKVNSSYIFRDRPFTSLNSLYVPEDVKSVLMKWTSFPSGHTRETALYSTIIAGFVPVLAIPVYIFAIFVAFSRVYLGVHYPTDVIAGLLIGYLSGKVALMISREIQLIVQNRFTPKKDIENVLDNKPEENGK